MFSQIIRIINNGVTSLFCNIDGEKNSIFKICISFIIIPLIVAIYFKNRDMKNIIDILINCLSIFTALIFSALFIVPDKLSQRIKYLQEKRDDSKNNYLIRFLNFSKIFVKQVSFIIVLLYGIDSIANITENTNLFNTCFCKFFFIYCSDNVFTFNFVKYIYIINGRY